MATLTSDRVLVQLPMPAAPKVIMSETRRTTTKQQQLYLLTSRSLLLLDGLPMFDHRIVNHFGFDGFILSAISICCHHVFMAVCFRITTFLTIVLHPLSPPYPHRVSASPCPSVAQTASPPMLPRSTEKWRLPTSLQTTPATPHHRSRAR